MTGKNGCLLMRSVRKTIVATGLTSRRTWTGRAFALCVCFSCCFWATVATNAATFTASLDRDTITLGESATLSLTFEGGSPDNVPTPPGNPNLQVVESGTSTQFKFINGQSSSAVTHTFRLI